MKVTSNTIVRNGMPFVPLVITHVLSFVDECLITVSKKSSDDTFGALERIRKQNPDKVFIDWEDVSVPGELTEIRQKQLDQSRSEWIMFLDADDLWFPEQLGDIRKYLDEDNDGLAINPYQMVDEKNHDGSWSMKFFTKFFRKAPGVHYRHSWPRDLIYKHEDVLYWKKNPRVPRIPVRFYHLSNLMKWRFRNENWAAEYKSTVGRLESYPGEEEENVRYIFDFLRTYK